MRIIRNKITLFAIALLSMSAAKVAAQDAMVVTMADGTSKEMQLASVSKLTFADGSLNVFDIGMPTSAASAVALADVKTIKFVDSADGIMSARMSMGTSMKLGYADGQVFVTGFDGRANASLYAVGGQKVLDIKGWDGSPVGVSSLQAGMYILKVNNKTLKIVKK